MHQIHDFGWGTPLGELTALDLRGLLLSGGEGRAGKGSRGE